jgi:hypothetical protein
MATLPVVSVVPLDGIDAEREHGIIPPEELFDKSPSTLQGELPHRVAAAHIRLESDPTDDGADGG